VGLKGSLEVKWDGESQSLAEVTVVGDLFRGVVAVGDFLSSVGDSGTICGLTRGDRAI